jgi:hypothetical protein
VVYQDPPASPTAPTLPWRLPTHPTGPCQPPLIHLTTRPPAELHLCSILAMSQHPQVTITPYPTAAQHNDRRASYPDDMSTTSSTSSISDPEMKDPTLHPRPRLGSRKSSGTIIIHRDSPNIEIEEEEYDDGDARTMSPRRSSEEIEKMGQDARQALIE